MSFNWEDYLILAEVLLKGRSTLASEEACLRSAISRSYYSVFICARNFAASRGELAPTGTGRDHGLIREHFKRSSDRNRKQIYAYLNRLSKSRKTADYDNIIKSPHALLLLAQFSINQAKDVLKTLRALP
jgi:uncharacterized protein (UPF0332 family)